MAMENWILGETDVMKPELQVGSFRKSIALLTIASGTNDTVSG